MGFDVFDLASIYGPILVIVCIWNLLYRDDVMKVVESVKATPAIFYMTAFINLLLGLTTLRIYAEWGWNLEMLVTLLGWVWVVRGICLLFFPKLLMKCSFDVPKKLPLYAVIGLVWGLALSYLAFSVA